MKEFSAELVVIDISRKTFMVPIDRIYFGIWHILLDILCDLFLNIGLVISILVPDIVVLTVSCPYYYVRLDIVCYKFDRFLNC